MSEPDSAWIIQRCINAFRNEYQDWPGYCERLLTRDEMLVALAVTATGRRMERSSQTSGLRVVSSGKRLKSRSAVSNS